MNARRLHLPKLTSLEHNYTLVRFYFFSYRLEQGPFETPKVKKDVVHGNELNAREIFSKRRINPDGIGDRPTTQSSYYKKVFDSLNRDTRRHLGQVD